MAITVESTASTNYTSGSVTITKPTGLSVDDLMIACIAIESGTPATPAGWTLIESNDAVMTASIYAKVADSSDVAASNFTFSPSVGSPYMAGAILRLTGYASGAYDGGSDGDTDNTQTPDLSFTGFTPPYDNCLLIAMMAVGDWDPGGSNFVTAMTINGTNPSWTEVADLGLTTNSPGAGDEVGILVAYATQTTAAAITDFDITIDTGTYGNPGDWASAIMAVVPRVDVTGTFSHLSVSPTIVAPTASVGVTATHSHLAVAATTNALSGTASAPTQWANEAGTSTTWTNESSL